MCIEQAITSALGCLAGFSSRLQCQIWRWKSIPSSASLARQYQYYRPTTLDLVFTFSFETPRHTSTNLRACGQQHCALANVSMEVAKLLPPCLCQLMPQLPSNPECYWSSASLFHSSFLLTPTSMSELHCWDSETSSSLQSRWWGSSALFCLFLCPPCAHKAQFRAEEAEGDRSRRVHFWGCVVRALQRRADVQLPRSTPL